MELHVIRQIDTLINILSFHFFCHDIIKWKLWHIFSSSVVKFETLYLKKWVDESNFPATGQSFLRVFVDEGPTGTPISAEDVANRAQHALICLVWRSILRVRQRLFPSRYFLHLDQSESSVCLDVDQWKRTRFASLDQSKRLLLPLVQPTCYTSVTDTLQAGSQDG